MTQTRSLPRDHVPSVPCTSEVDRALHGVFTTALEGGIGYWSVCTRYRWSIGDEAMTEARDFIAVIEDTEEAEEGEDGPEYVIDRAVIARGARLLYEHMRRLSQAGTASAYQWQAAKDLHWGKWDDLDYDADTADMVVQFGLFGKLIYG
jgi:hypothetical protein